MSSSVSSNPFSLHLKDKLVEDSGVLKWLSNQRDITNPDCLRRINLVISDLEDLRDRIQHYQPKYAVGIYLGMEKGEPSYGYIYGPNPQLSKVKVFPEHLAPEGTDVHLVRMTGGKEVAVAHWNHEKGEWDVLASALG